MHFCPSYPCPYCRPVCPGCGRPYPHPYVTEPWVTREQPFWEWPVHPERGGQITITC